MHNMNRGGVCIVPTEKPRYSIAVDEELLKEIDDFRFENRYPSRSAATVELIRRGLESLKREQQQQAQKKSDTSKGRE